MVTIPEGAFAVGDFDVEAAGAMARFATDVDVGEGRVVTIFFGVEGRFEVGAVAIGAHRLPSLGDAGPVQRVLGGEFIFDVGRAEIKPAAVDRVPAQSEDLDTRQFPFGVGFGILSGVGGEFDHVLLERIDPEDIFDFEVLHFAGFAFGMDHEPLAVAEHAARHPVMFDLGVVEIAEDRFVGRQVHRQVVVGTGEGLGLVAMAFDARRATDEGGFGVGRDSAAEVRIGDTPDPQCGGCHQGQKDRVAVPTAGRHRGGFRVRFQGGSGRG